MLRFIFFIAFFVSQSLVFAQFYTGVKGGMLYSQGFFMDEAITNDHYQYPYHTPSIPLQGQTGGLWIAYYNPNARFLEDKYMGFRMELNYVQKGWQFEPSSGNVYYQKHISLIEMPILAQFRTRGRYVQFMLNFGPYVGYLYQTTQTTNIPDADLTWQVNQTGDSTVLYPYNFEKYQPYQLGLTSGMGLNVSIMRSNIEIMVSYGQTLTNMTERDVSWSRAIRQIQSLSATVGYSFRFGKPIPAKPKKDKDIVPQK